MKANDFDKKFDDGNLVVEHLDLKRASRPGVTRQSIIKVRLAERLDEIKAQR